MRAETRDRTGDLQIFSLTLSQLSYRGLQVHHQFEADQRRRAETALVQILELSIAGSKMKVKRYQKGCRMSVAVCAVLLKYAASAPMFSQTTRQ